MWEWHRCPARHLNTTANNIYNMLLESEATILQNALIANRSLSTLEELLKQRTLVDIVSNEANTEWYRYSALTLIENLCKQLDIKLIVIPTTRIHPNNSQSETDLARDLEHHGRIENRYTTEWIINKMKEEGYENFIN